MTERSSSRRAARAYAESAMLQAHINEKSWADARQLLVRMAADPGFASLDAKLQAEIARFLEEHLSPGP